ncbi:hypothetical protein Tco_1477135 [Tanacetum coccineum]
MARSTYFSPAHVMTHSNYPTHLTSAQPSILVFESSANFQRVLTLTLKARSPLYIHGSEVSTAVVRKWYCIFLMNGFNVVVLLAAAPAVHVTQGLLIRHKKSSTKGLDYLNQRYDLLRGEMDDLRKFDIVADINTTIRQSKNHSVWSRYYRITPIAKSAPESDINERPRDDAEWVCDSAINSEIEA